MVFTHIRSDRAADGYERDGGLEKKIDQIKILSDSLFDAVAYLRFALDVSNSSLVRERRSLKVSECHREDFRVSEIGTEREGEGSKKKRG